MKYAIIQIRKQVSQSKSYLGSESCYEMLDWDYETLESARRKKSEMEYPDHYIIIQYWE